MEISSSRSELLTKSDLLAYLAGVADADAQEVAHAFLLRYSVAAMALLRLVRQGLADRSRQTEQDVYRYRLSARGRARLQYFQQAGRASGTQSSVRSSLD